MSAAAACSTCAIPGDAALGARGIPAAGGPRRARFPWVHRLAVLGVIVTLLFPVLSGGVVTSLDVGMAYGTWPGFHDQGFLTVPFSVVYEQGGAGALIEHGHRLAGALLGCVALALLAACWLRRGVPARWRWLALGVVLLVVLQGLAGAQRVLLNDRAIAVFHAVGAQLVLVSFVALAKLSAPRWSAGRAQPAAPPGADPQLRRWSALSVAVLFVHLWAGAGLRHRQASLSGHLLLAVVVTFVLLAVVYQVYTRHGGRPELRRPARGIVSLLGLQLALGLATWAFKLGPLAAQTPVLVHSTLATAHLVVGAAIMALAAALALEARLPAAEEARS